MQKSSLQIREASRADMRKVASEGRLYAILDACDEPAVPPKVTEIGPEHAVSLYQGQAEHEQWAVAPYLAKVDEELFDWITSTLWPKPWGVCVITSENILTLRKHLRRFLIVLDPSDETMYFRYYDPRILAAFLPTCTNAELTNFFGSIKAFAVSQPSKEESFSLFYR